MLVRANLVEPQRLPFGYARQRFALALIIFFVVLAVSTSHRHLVNAQIPVEFLHRAGRAKRVISRGNINARLIENRRQHL
jgi:hypothetical protein